MIPDVHLIKGGMMGELTVDDLYALAIKWGENEEQARAHLGCINAPGWTVPYRLHPAYNSFGFGFALLGRASRTCPTLEPERAQIAALRLAMAIGRNALGRASWADGYVGTPLLAARLTAQAMHAVLRTNFGEHAPFLGDLEDYIASLWPAPDRACRPRNVHLALALDRQLRSLDTYEQMPGLAELVKAGMNSDSKPYSIAVGHLLRRVLGDFSSARCQLDGPVLEDLLKAAEQAASSAGA
ncbi:hypothetical protein GCM10010156_48580 [Planobispora rosea]|uniref:Uncharacterized protein n=1 Tax=Planobispora rosea TaxID=35762 RepID=A0A8J3S3X6_PLARO|nr:hypothetical protein [Planobispora rosea]GGS84263.1 hypothetical protein GCM10010156_48580 [Planobispora rosea]GIH86369.1 hypothetical protein Pro02_47770 [Planobispora rosea]